jgi:hypothetical protein
MKFFIQKNAAVLLLLLTTIAFAHFGSRGPFGGGVTCAITVGTTTYLGTEYGGVFETSTSAVVAWRARPVGLKSGRITALAHNGEFVLAGTADSGVYILSGTVGSDRYFVKINSGLTNLHITSLLAINQNILLAGTPQGLFISTDKGLNWTASSNGNVNANEITALTKAGSRIVLATKSGGLFISDNNGSSWSGFNDSNTLNVDGTVAMAYNAIGDQLLVVNENGIYIAATASATSTPSFVLSENGLSSTAEVRAVSTEGTAWFLATNEGVISSLTAAINWTSINTGLTSNDVMAVVPNQSFLLCGTRNKGLFKATAVPFSTWAPFNTSFNNLKTYSMTSGGEMFVVAATELGVFVSKDLAASYVASNKGLIDSLNVQDITLADFCLLAATKNGGVYFSPDSGRNWTAINSGLMNTDIRHVFYNNGTKYAVCSNGNVYQSALHSSSWASIQTGLPSGVVPTSMAFFGSKILLGTLGHGVYYFSGNSWTAINTGLSNLNVTSVAALEHKIFAGTDGNGVFVSDSTTNAISWSATAPLSISHTTMIGLDGTKVQAMSSYRGYVFASYKGGLLASSNYGTTWIAGGNQFNLPSYTDVNKVSFVATRVFVTTENNSLYSNSLSELPFLNFTASVATITEGTTSQFTAAISPAPSSAVTIGWTSSNTAVATVDNTGFVTALSPGTTIITATAQNGSNLRAIRELLVSINTSTLNQTTKNVSIYPNPTKGSITVESANSQNQIQVLDVTGKVFLKTQLSSGASLDLSALPDGVYFLMVNEYVQRIVKSNE